MLLLLYGCDISLPYECICLIFILYDDVKMFYLLEMLYVGMLEYEMWVDWHCHYIASTFPYTTESLGGAAHDRTASIFEHLAASVAGDLPLLLS